MNSRCCSYPLEYLGLLGLLYWHRCIGCSTEYAFDKLPPLETPGVPDWLLEPPESSGILLAEGELNGNGIPARMGVEITVNGTGVRP